MPEMLIVGVRLFNKVPFGKKTLMVSWIMKPGKSVGKKGLSALRNTNETILFTDDGGVGGGGGGGELVPPFEHAISRSKKNDNIYIAPFLNIRIVLSRKPS
jgi:hypothetical protein